MSLSPVKVFATTGSRVLARRICEELGPRVGDDPLQLGKVDFEEFSNENILPSNMENVRGYFVVIVHTQVPPVHDGLFELFHLLDAVANSRARDILLVFPYMPYSRSDRKNKPRISVMGKRLAMFVMNFGIKRVLLLDPHDTHIKHYFEPSADEITSVYLIAGFIKKKFFSFKERENCVIVFSDGGAAKRFEKISDLLPTAYIDKGRVEHEEKTQIRGVVGNVKGKECLLFDDEILTGGTMIKDANILVEKGANSISAFIIHPVLAKKGATDKELLEELNNSPIEKFYITDSIPVEHKINAKFKILSVIPLLAEAIKRVVQNESVTALHNPHNVRFYIPNEPGY